MIRTSIAVWFIIVLLIFQSCNKEKTDKASIVCIIEYSVDSQPLIFDSLMYYNEAGNKYSVSKLNYYISDVHLSGNKNYKNDEIFYINARQNEYNFFELTGIEKGVYTEISLLIGLSPEKNISGSLPNTMENQNMAWPDNMGGGYHFLKLEGRQTTDNSPITGFAIHVGRNNYAIKCKIDYTLNIQANKNEIILKMNLNEWFRTPFQYDFNMDGNYTMNDTVLIGKIAANGKDVFTISRFRAL